jgi:hypothetical protein
LRPRFGPAPLRLVNSRDIWAGENRADARFTGQNGVAHDFKPVMKASCDKQRKHRKQRRR